ncbi:unnamed protein product [Anisakis simplex]|uniref:Secreted protein n=1 Tax=Anisakis simplex TaxID=6269 RepID=A0A0M3JSJ9_ANISI|nr:unnamed protein product [Anisakis simplex]
MSSQSSVTYQRSQFTAISFLLLILIVDYSYSFPTIDASNDELLESYELPMKSKRLSRHALIKLILQRGCRPTDHFWFRSVDSIVGLRWPPAEIQWPSIFSANDKHRTMAERGCWSMAT